MKCEHLGHLRHFYYYNGGHFGCKTDLLNINVYKIMTKGPILYNYSLLLRSIRVAMDLQNNIHRSL